MTRERRAISAAFLLSGAIFGSWAARVPAVRDRAGLSDGELGLALGAIALGAVLAMPAAGAWSARRGSRGPTRAGLAAAAVALGLSPLATSPAALVPAMLVFGMAFGTVDVAMNAHGVAVERRAERPILSGLHAGFSAGGLLGAGLGALVAGAGIDVRVHLAAAGATALAIGIVATRGLLDAGQDAGAAGAPLVVRPPRRLLALAVLAFACLLLEGAAADWSAVYLRDSAKGSAAAAALGFTAFSVAMTAVRLAGDALTLRLGAERLVLAGALLAAAGTGTALAAGGVVAGIAGFACLGAGMAAVVPIAFRAAGSTPGLEPGVALAAVTTPGYLGFVVGPPLIGALAELTSLPRALVLVPALCLVVAGLSRAVRLTPASPGAPTRRSRAAAAAAPRAPTPGSR